MLQGEIRVSNKIVGEYAATNKGAPVYEDGSNGDGEIVYEARIRYENGIGGFTYSKVFFLLHNPADGAWVLTNLIIEGAIERMDTTESLTLDAAWAEFAEANDIEMSSQPPKF